MLIEDRDRKRSHPPSVVDADEQEDPINTPGPSASPPPAFDTIHPNAGGEHVEFADSNFFVPPGGEGPPPPDFAPYVAEYFEASDGSVVSHDEHLNKDGGWPPNVWKSGQTLITASFYLNRRGTLPLHSLPITDPSPTVPAHPRAPSRTPNPLRA